jgi:hypothetical protein
MNINQTTGLPFTNLRTKKDNDNKTITVLIDLNLEELNELNYDIKVIEESLAKYKTGSLHLNITLEENQNNA